MLYLVTGLKELDHLHYLRLMTEGMAASRLDSPAALKEFNRLENKAYALPAYLFISRMIIPSLSSAGKKSLKSSARLRVTQAAIAAERYRLEHGEWPEQLVAPVPTDPFDGQPLRYRRTETGIVVWSIGEDGRDDGGRERRPGALEPDISFTIDRPPKR
ncbi:MAG: hypothetical protein PCFJNLEI_03127 [Verrucomicrobiae bacterium]|nr:hypothetical protein [Verrucomicrobiae bacterium]